MSKLAVVIVSWNTRDLTRNCLRSLFDDMAEIDGEVWVVDNDSSDDSVAMIKDEFPQVKLIQNSENVGFARANNQALRQASADYCLLLNSDTIVPAGLTRILLDFMDSNPDASACAPRQINGDGETINFPRNLPSVKGELLDCLSYHFFPFGRVILPSRKLFRARNPQDRTPVRADLLSAACLLINKATIEQIGLLSEDYFLFSEENDYFTRVKLAGLKSYYLPGAEIVHLVGKSRARRGNSDSEVNFFRSRLIYFEKFFKSRIKIIRAIYFFFFGWSMFVAKLNKTLRGRSESEYLRTYRALFQLLRGGRN